VILVGWLLVLALTLGSVRILASDEGATVSIRRAFERIDAVHGPIKWAAVPLFLVAADRLVLGRRLRGGRAALLLWLPALSFVAFATLHWGIVGDAYIHFSQRREIWEGGFSGALILMGLSFPPVLALVLLNYGIVTWIVRRRGAAG
jgi:hypothetical protein